MEKPAFAITDKTRYYHEKIIEEAVRLEAATDFLKDIRLHRENRIRTVFASLSIEGCALSLDEVRSVIDGREVAGRADDIRDTKNAYAAYGALPSLNPYSVADFLQAHALMTAGAFGPGEAHKSGAFRQGDVGVVDGQGHVLHAGAKPQFVPGLVENLLAWAKATDLHPVLKSAVAHYEIELIHPFADGNGRMGRLWQTLILARWNPVFASLSMESVVNVKRREYYRAIADCGGGRDGGPFIEFMAAAIYEEIHAQYMRQMESK